MSKSHHIAKKGRNCVQQYPKRGFLFSEKRVSRFRGCLRRLLHMRMSPKWVFLFSGKSFCRFRGCRMHWCKNAHVPFLTIIVFGKSWVWFGNVFAGVVRTQRHGLIFWFSHHLPTQNRFVRRHLNRQIRPMICDTFCPTIFATGQCCVPWQMQTLCKERVSCTIVHLFRNLKTNWWF